MLASQPVSQDAVPGVTAACQLCQKTAIDKSVKCSVCGELSHVGCLINDFKSPSGKPSQQWLTDFLSAGNFLLACKACVTAGGKPSLVFPCSETTTPRVSAATDRFSDEINDMKQSIKCLTTKVESIMTGIGLSNDNGVQSATGSIDSDSTEATKTLKPVKSTYAQMLSNNITSAVKSALDSQRKDERDSSAVIIYGLQENGCDWDDVTDIFSLISCCAKPHKMHRFGRADRYGARPLKIEFYSPSDSREVLACARQLRDNDATYHLRLSPWLNQQQMSKIKDLRSKCTELNNTAAASGDNSRPYVVISGELKVRTKGGKLVPYKRLSVGKPSQQMSSKPPSDGSSAVKPPPPSDSSSHPKNA